jgi:hypothetical protein
MSTLSRIRPTTAVVPLLVAVVGGLLAGVLTSVLQGALPGRWNALADSGAVWTVVAFALALPAVREAWVSVAAGTLALLGEVVGYYAVALPLREIASSPSERVMWTCAALVVGPFVGLAARWVRRGTGTERTVAVLALDGVAIGEALHRLARIPGQEGVGQAWLLVALAVAAVTLVVGGASWQGRVLAVGAAAVTASGVALVYGAPLFL